MTAKKSQLTLFQEMTKKGDIVDDADDDNEVRASAAQNPATLCSNSSSGLSICSFPLISEEWCRGGGGAEEIL